MTYCANCGALKQEDDRSNKEMSFLTVLFSFRGRINRSTFWLKGVGLLAGLLVALNILIEITTDDVVGGLLVMLLCSVMLYVWLAVIIKRVHDLDQPATVGVLLIPLPFIGVFVAHSVLTGFDHRLLIGAGATTIPVIGLFVAVGVLIKVAFAKGTHGPNRYGDQP